MTNLFSDRVTTSWGSRIGSSIGGALIGGLLFLVAFPLLFWNEGRAVRDAKRLAEGAKSVITVPADKVDPANNGREICVTGAARTDQNLADPHFKINANALALQRSVQMYQWKENSHDEKQTGGAVVTTYSYEKVWSGSKIDSDNFHRHTDDSGHNFGNPHEWPLENQTQRADNITLAAFKLSPELIQQISAVEPLPPTAAASSQPGADPASQPAVADDLDSKTAGDLFYVGSDPDHPQVGDLKVAFKITRPGPVTVVAQQAGNSFVPFPTKVGGTISMLRLGTHTADEMFKMAEADAAMLTWILRLVGFALMFVGIMLALKPLTMAVAFLPFLEGLADTATGLVALLGSGILSLTTIALAWLFYRPLPAIALLAVAGGLLFILIRSRRARRMA